MNSTCLQLVAARYSLGLVSTDEVVQLAHGLLDADIYTEGLGELVTRPFLIFSDAEPWFRRAMRELGISTDLASQDAVFRVFKYYVCELYEGRLGPRDMSARFRREFHQELEFTPASKIVDQLGGWDFASPVYLYDAEEVDVTYGWLSRREAAATFRRMDKELLATADRWIQNHCSSQFMGEWLSPVCRSLAESIKADRAFDRLPILADALEEAGCNDREILDHCRQPGEHVRGCWVVDLILGKK